MLLLKKNVRFSPQVLCGKTIHSSPIFLHKKEKSLRADRTPVLPWARAQKKKKKKKKKKIVPFTKKVSLTEPRAPVGLPSAGFGQRRRATREDPF
jgi:hypothetical protein